MKIQRMFRDDINRKINGVVKVDQNANDVLVQELNEYVITKELKKHFITFFNNYLDAFDEETADIGVWISGFFGSGKSHFLKILSYLLENREVDGIRTVERFRSKFEKDPGTFMLIDRATQYETDTILFNIDIEGSIHKDKTAVLRVFAKMFYNFLGFYGENLKVAKFEQFIEKQGKTKEFRHVFEEKNGASWLEARDAYAFFEDDIVAAMQDVLGISEQAARNWFNGSETIETSIAQLVSEIKEYVESKPKNYRLLFMVDEVGQYVGGDTDLLMNLQSFVEKIGSECSGKVWVVCTGQEAIDEIIKAREDEFSRIQARFKTRLSLSSSSADEVIQKRILKKTDEAEKLLENVYSSNDSILRNLFSFTDAVLDIKGFSAPNEFSRNFPFIPYQFILMQKVFSEIRKHGNSGKHLSGGERSMLSGFQEAAQKIENQDEYALAPFYLFYDTVHTFLDSSIRRVIERCEKAAANGAGIEPQDVAVLKLLYLIRYIDDVKANLDNIVILMANDIRMDKITMREQVRGSLDRLLSQNYIGRTGDTYNFLTDEEQDIQREINRNTPIDTSAITERIAHMIFGDIYTSRKFRYGKYDFPFDQMVDNTAVGMLSGGMRLRILTVATDAAEKQELTLLANSAGQAIVVLAENPYYTSLENAMKIRKYIKQRNVAQLPKSVQKIISNKQDEASELEAAALKDLQKAIIDARFYVDRERLNLKSGDAKYKLDQALEYLVSNVYKELGLITKNAETDADIISILRGDENMAPGTEPNIGAAAQVEKYLEMQFNKALPTSMADIQTRYQAIPYGWKEIDIAAVVALLIHNQRVTIKYAGATIQPDNPKLPDMLRKRTEIGKTSISIRQVVSVQKMREVRDFLRDYYDEMDIPEDEDGLIAYIVGKFNKDLAHYLTLQSQYRGHIYPDKAYVDHAITLVQDVLSQQKDNIALIDRVIARENNLYDMKESLLRVEEFFKNQVSLFDAAVKFAKDLQVDAEYIAKDPVTEGRLNEIRHITTVPDAGSFGYKQIPELNGLMQQVKASHDAMLESKRQELLENVVRECMAVIHTAAENNHECMLISNKADAYYTQKKEQIAETEVLALLDGLEPQMWKYKDNVLEEIDKAKKPVVHQPRPEPLPIPQTQKVIRNVPRLALFPGRVIYSEAEIDEYVEFIRRTLKQQLANSDGIRLN